MYPTLNPQRSVDLKADVFLVETTLDGEDLENFSKSPFRMVRLAVTCNDSTFKVTLISLTLDKNTDVRDAARRALRRQENFFVERPQG